MVESFSDARARFFFSKKSPLFFDLFDDFAIVELERKAARKVLDTVGQWVFRGRDLHVTLAPGR